MRLDITLMNRRHEKAVLEGPCGVGETELEIAAAKEVLRADVGKRMKLAVAADRRYRRMLVALGMLVKARRLRPHRLQRIEHRRQFLVFDFDQAHGVFRRLGRLSRDRRHLFADEADMLQGQDRDIAKKAADSHLGQIGRSHHRMNAGQRTGRRHIDRNDTRVRKRAAQRLPPQHPRQRHIRTVAGAAGYLGRTLDVAGGLADTAQNSHARSPIRFGLG